MNRIKNILQHLSCENVLICVYILSFMQMQSFYNNNYTVQQNSKNISKRHLKAESN